MKRGRPSAGSPFGSCSFQVRVSITTIDYTPMVMHGPAMARNKISTTVYITAEQNEQLKLLHNKTKVPVAEYVRQGIDLVLERERVHLPGQLTLDVIRR
jgi:Ribbon-helix-helix domain